jgi:hypothetical protein
MLRTGDPSQASHLFRRAALILAVLPGGALTVDASAAQRLVFTQVPIESGFDLPAGSRIVSYDPSRPKDGVTNLTREFSTAPTSRSTGSGFSSSAGGPRTTRWTPGR